LKGDGSTEEGLPHRTVVITGAAGNLGEKAAKYLLRSKNAKYKLLLMDCAPRPEVYSESTIQKSGHTVEYIKCDFSKYEKSWVDKLSSAFTVFLFAAKHPQPDANSSEVFSSMMINSNLLEACAQARAGRVVLASSNHVMGGMLQETGKIPAGARPMIGTKYEIPGASMDSTLYASAKVAAEVQVKAMVDSGRLPSAIITRIGFCQPGENKKESLPITGMPEPQLHKNERRSVRNDKAKEHISNWWKGMYLSNEDFEKMVERCLEASDTGKRGAKQLMYVNGVSANPEGRWELDGNDIGFQPAN
jgi:nucleoside-diphosphate-sugar epimerase